MGGIYIPGMEMPSENEEIGIVIRPDGSIHYQFDLKCRTIATATPVPDHGRLIDADAVRDEIDKSRPDRIYEDAWTLAVIDDAQTVIPADKDCPNCGADMRRADNDQ